MQAIRKTLFAAAATVVVALGGCGAERDVAPQDITQAEMEMNMAAAQVPMAGEP